MDGGKVSNVTYPSQDPIDKTLKSFQVDITDNPPLADLLNQLRGAKLTVVKSDGTKLDGTILGVEKKERTADDDKKTPIEVAFLNLLEVLRFIRSSLMMCRIFSSTSRNCRTN